MIPIQPGYLARTGEKDDERFSRMNRMSVFLRLSLVLLCIATLNGVAMAEDPPPPSAAALDASQKTHLVESFNRWAAGIHALSSGGKAHVGAEGEKTRVFNFSMLVARPGNARVQGRWGGL